MRCGALAGILGLGGCVEPNPIYIDPNTNGGDTGSTTGIVMTSTDSEVGSTETTKPTTTGDITGQNSWPDTDTMSLPSGYCGDSQVGPDEQCDDGDDDPNDGCYECLLTECGNSRVQPGETCDDGNFDDNDDCVNCQMAVCGDETVWAGSEDCDDGNLDNSDDCLNICKTAKCGDFEVHSGVEECDDANDDDTDDCLTTCVLAGCGDGMLHVAVEECDDGNIDDADECRNDCTKPHAAYRIFVGSLAFTGNMGGIAGADAKCNGMALIGGLTGTYHAWLGAKDGPADRMYHAPRPYVRTDGLQVAANWEQLTTGTLVGPIDKDESGKMVPMLPAVCGNSGAVYSNVGKGGTFVDGNSCTDWTSNAGIANAGVLGPGGLMLGKWTNFCQINCNTPGPIYCVEQ